MRRAPFAHRSCLSPEATEACKWPRIGYYIWNMSDIAEPSATLPAQSSNAILMIRPSRFYPNPETAADNVFQARSGGASDGLTAAARSEFDTAVQILRDAGVNVHVFEDTAEPA